MPGRAMSEMLALIAPVVYRDTQRYLPIIEMELKRAFQLIDTEHV